MSTAPGPTATSRGLALRRPGGVLGGNRLFVVLGAVAVLLAALFYWRVWDGGLGSPLVYEGDGLLYQRLARTISQRGWYLLRNPVLGAPNGQVLYDYPLGGDNLHFVFFRVLAFGTSNPFLITNVFYFLTFPLVYLAGYYAFRRLEISGVLAMVLSVIYTLAPYHFVRNPVNLFLAAYYAVPLACLLLYELLAHQAEVGDNRDHLGAPEPAPTLRTWLRSRAFWWGRWLWVPVLLGSTGAYYAFFFVFVALAIGGLTALSGRTLRALVRPLVVAVVTLFVLALNNAPSLVYRMQHGTNAVVAKRTIGEADTFSLQFAHLLLPVEGHRIGPLADLRTKADQSISPLSGMWTTPLGATAAVGFVLSLAALVANGRDRRDRWRELARRSGTLNVLAFLLGSVGGASLLLGVFGFVQLRDYGRLVIFIAFFSLVALGASVQPLLRRLPTPVRRIKPVVAVLLVALVSGGALLDQTGPRIDRKGAQARAADDRRLATAIEQLLGADAMVLQVPLVGFPEDTVAFPARALPSAFVANGYEFYNGYELFRPTLYTNSIRWSYGAIQNRPDDILPSFASKPVPLFLQQAVAVGFSGIYVDRRTLPDNAVTLVAELTAELGEPTLKNDETVFFDLRGYRQRIVDATPAAQFSRLQDEVRHPLELGWMKGFDAPDGYGRFFPQLPGVTSGRWAANGATLEVTNPTSSARTLTLDTKARLGPAGSAQLLTAVNDGQVQRFTITQAGDPVVVRAVIPPGTSRITFATDRADGIVLTHPVRTMTFRLEDIWWEG